jgi:hypothetical protein
MQRFSRRPEPTYHPAAFGRGFFMGAGIGKRIVGGALALIGIYPIVTANHVQNIFSGLALFLIGIAVFAWSYRR